MAHRAEQIMAAVLTTLTGLATTGANAFRGRDNPLPDTITAALFIWQGSDEIEERYANDQIQSVLTVNVDAVAAVITGPIDTTLNQIRLEVVKALTLDETLGLSFVDGIMEETAEAVEVSSEGDRAFGGMRIAFSVFYQYTRTNPET